MVRFALEGGRASCFAYGQTGSGKTYTMIGNKSNPGLYALSANKILQMISPHSHNLLISYFEIYCGKLYDLLNKRKKLSAMEDKNNKIQIKGLKRLKVQNVK